MEWQSMDTAPKGRPFLALNHDREVHVARIDKAGRLMRRSHQQRFSQKFTVQKGSKVLDEESFSFDTHWTIWQKGYEFKPTHWTELEPPA